ncbi:type II 3-dehydroquinate dehydratase [Clostridium drakei]|uniref:3-dehydroquinate dehydratase n=2 Tax=Clostridium TaxID=1485 RepID=A0A2U8DUD5_9CLOT|nr:type II 3-dehydroquinate dehydratase [Clostridium drakei]
MVIKERKSTMKKVMLLHGINHNMFGKRDPKQYGTITLDEINEKVNTLSKELEIEVTNFQTNSEREFVDKIHQAYLEGYDGLMLNAGAWTHYSYGMSDALAILEVPIIELHMSNVHAREEFRHHSVISPLATGIIVGLGAQVYTLGLQAFANIFKEQNK